ncbi:unnamed protein product [Lampetra planeri]
MAHVRCVHLDGSTGCVALPPPPPLLLLLCLDVPRFLKPLQARRRGSQLMLLLPAFHGGDVTRTSFTGDRANTRGGGTYRTGVEAGLVGISGTGNLVARASSGLRRGVAVTPAGVAVTPTARARQRARAALPSAPFWPRRRGLAERPPAAMSPQCPACTSLAVAPGTGSDVSAAAQQEREGTFRGSYVRRRASRNAPENP